MLRNLDHRIELLFPVEESSHRKYIMEVLKLQMKDNVKARELMGTGEYRRVRGKGHINSQELIADLTRDMANIDEQSPVTRLVQLGKVIRREDAND